MDRLAVESWLASSRSWKVEVLLIWRVRSGRAQCQQGASWIVLSLCPRRQKTTRCLAWWIWYDYKHHRYHSYWLSSAQQICGSHGSRMGHCWAMLGDGGSQGWLQASARSPIRISVNNLGALGALTGCRLDIHWCFKALQVLHDLLHLAAMCSFLSFCWPLDLSTQLKHWSAGESTLRIPKNQAVHLHHHQHIPVMIAPRDIPQDPQVPNANFVAENKQMWSNIII